MSVAGTGESPIERYRLPLHMAIWEYRRADEEVQLVLAEARGLLKQLDKKVVAIDKAIERHTEKVAAEQMATRQAADQVELQAAMGRLGTMGPVSMDVDISMGPVGGSEPLRLIGEVVRDGAAVAMEEEASQEPTGMDVELGESTQGAGEGGGCGGGITEGDAGAMAPRTQREIEEEWLQMCMKQDSAREAAESRSSIAFLKQLRTETYKLRGATTGVLSQISGGISISEEEEVQQQVQAVLEEYNGRDEAENEIIDEDDM